MTESKPKLNVSSLSERRKQQLQLQNQLGKEVPQRVLELEQECLKLVDALIEIEERLASQEKHMRILLTALNNA